jgi:hypothetical protein
MGVLKRSLLQVWAKSRSDRENLSIAVGDALLEKIRVWANVWCHAFVVLFSLLESDSVCPYYLVRKMIFSKSFSFLRPIFDDETSTHNFNLKFVVFCDFFSSTKNDCHTPTNNNISTRRRLKIGGYLVESTEQARMGA